MLGAVGLANESVMAACPHPSPSPRMRDVGVNWKKDAELTTESRQTCLPWVPAPLATGCALL